MQRSLLVILLYFGMKKLTTLTSNIELDEELWLTIYVFILQAQNLHLLMLNSKSISGVLPFLDMLHDNPNLNEVCIKVNNAPTGDDETLRKLQNTIIK